MGLLRKKTKECDAMILVFRFLQPIIILFMLVTTGLVVDSWLKTSPVKGGIFFGLLAVFAGMAAILELLIKNRKKREKRKKEHPGEGVQKRWNFMNSVYRCFQVIVILFMLLIVLIQIFPHNNSNSSFEWLPFLATLAIFGGMAAILEALIQSRKRRKAHKEKYNEAYIKTLEHLEFRFSKLKGLILFILMLALILAVMYLGALDNSPLIREIVEKLKLGEDRWLAFLGLEFGCLALLIQGTRKMHFLYVVNGDKPYLSINESGLFSPNVGELSWRDILGFELITRSVRSSRIYYLRVLPGPAGGKSKHKDIQLNGIQELEPEYIFAIARWLHEKYTGGRNAVSTEFQEQLDEAEIQMQRGAALLEQAVGQHRVFSGNEKPRTGFAADATPGERFRLMSTKTSVGQKLEGMHGKGMASKLQVGGCAQKMDRSPAFSRNTTCRRAGR